MDRTGAKYAETPVNRDAVLQFILVMLFLQRPRDSCSEVNPATFSFSLNEAQQIQGFPCSIERNATPDFS
jgi:hypothetical protein